MFATVTSTLKIGLVAIVQLNLLGKCEPGSGKNVPSLLFQEEMYLNK